MHLCVFFQSISFLKYSVIFISEFTLIEEKLQMADVNAEYLIKVKLNSFKHLMYVRKKTTNEFEEITKSILTANILSEI